MTFIDLKQKDKITFIEEKTQALFSSRSKTRDGFICKQQLSTVIESLQVDVLLSKAKNNPADGTVQVDESHKDEIQFTVAYGADYGPTTDGRGINPEDKEITSKTGSITFKYNELNPSDISPIGLAHSRMDVVPGTEIPVCYRTYKQFQNLLLKPKTKEGFGFKNIYEQNTATAGSPIFGSGSVFQERDSFIALSFNRKRYRENLKHDSFILKLDNFTPKYVDGNSQKLSSAIDSEYPTPSAAKSLKSNGVISNKFRIKTYELHIEGEKEVSGYLIPSRGLVLVSGLLFGPSGKYLYDSDSSTVSQVAQVNAISKIDKARATLSDGNTVLINTNSTTPVKNVNKLPYFAHPLRAFLRAAGIRLNENKDVKIKNSENLKISAESLESNTTNTYFINVGADELNYTTNTTFTDSNGIIRSKQLVSNPRTYPTTVGIYNNTGDLLIVGKLTIPAEKTFNSQLNFAVKVDF